MKKYFFTVGQTYTEVTPESASDGDFSDAGWEVEKTNDWTIDDILRALNDQGVEHIESGTLSISIYGWTSTICYRTATDKQLCLHIDGTERNIARLNKIIKQKFQYRY